MRNKDISCCQKQLLAVTMTTKHLSRSCRCGSGILGVLFHVNRDRNRSECESFLSRKTQRQIIILYKPAHTKAGRVVSFHSIPPCTYGPLSEDIPVCFCSPGWSRTRWVLLSWSPLLAVHHQRMIRPPSSASVRCHRNKHRHISILPSVQNSAVIAAPSGQLCRVWRSSEGGSILTVMCGCGGLGWGWLTLCVRSYLVRFVAPLQVAQEWSSKNLTRRENKKLTQCVQIHPLCYAFSHFFTLTLNTVIGLQVAVLHNLLYMYM